MQITCKRVSNVLRRVNRGKEPKGGKGRPKDGKPIKAISREKDAGRFLYPVLNIKRG